MNVYLESGDIDHLIKLIDGELYKVRSALTDDDSDYAHGGKSVEKIST